MFSFPAERTGLIIPIGEWVLRQASRQMRIWQQEYPQDPSLQLSVNLSTSQLMHPHLAETVAQILQETGLDFSSLILEITETTIMADQERANQILRRLNGMCIKVHLDDFCGTGYSSLSYLQNLDIQGIKFDRSPQIYRRAPA